MNPLSPKSSGEEEQRDEAPLVNPSEFENWVIYEDESVVALNKPGWLVCHPSKNGPWSSLVGAVREHFQLEQTYLAGRLDRETSGVVLLAKNETAGRHWQKALEEKKVRRSYWAILVGKLENCVHVSGFLGKDPDSPVFVKQRVTVNSRKSKKAETSFFPLFSANGYTLCAVVTKTGRKHQIRVHAQSLEFPLVGEKLYGLDENYYLEFCRGGWRQEWIETLEMKRQALHARTFGFVENGPTFVAPLAEDFIAFLDERLGMDDRALDLAEKNAQDWVEIQFKGE
jgi:23S rRNA pseudouridine1911/1915/1917 synthase